MFCLTLALFLSLSLLGHAGPVGEDPPAPLPHVFFRDIGATITTRGTAHLVAEVDIFGLLTHIQTTSDQLTAFQTWHYQVGRATPWVPRKLEQLHHLDSQVTSLLHIGDGNAPRLQKRFLAEIFGITGTIFGIWNTIQLESIKSEVQKQGNAISSLFHEVQDQQTRLHDHATAINGLKTAVAQMVETQKKSYEEHTINSIFTDAISSLTTHVMELTQIVDALLHKQFSVAIIKPGEFGKIIMKIRNRAEAQGYNLLTRTDAEAYQCDASFLVTGTGITAFLHLPLAKKSDHLTIFEYLPVPVAAGDHHHITVVPDHPIIAITEDRQGFITMSLPDLQRCQRLGSLYLCDHANIKAKVSLTTGFDEEKDATLCIYFLWTQDFEKVKKACTTHIHARRNFGLAISGNQYVFVSAEPHQGTLTCHGRKQTQFSAYDISVVEVPAGCVAETGYYKATGAIDLDAQAPVHSFQWPKSPKELIADIVGGHHHPLRRRGHHGMQSPKNQRRET